MKYQKIKGIKHFVFSDKDEFETHFLALGQEVPSLIEDWRQGEEGDWVVSDDGAIVQLLRVLPLKSPALAKKRNKDRKYCRTVVGAFIMEPQIKMDTDFSKRETRYSFGGKRHRVFTRTKPTKNERIMVAALISGHTPQNAYEAAYTPKTNWKKHFCEIIKQKRIVKLMSQNAKDAAKELGIDFKLILINIKAIAEESNSDSIRLRALEMLVKLLKDESEIHHQTNERHLHLHSPFGADELKAIQSEKLALEE